MSWKKATMKLKRNPTNNNKKTSDQGRGFKMDKNLLVKQYFSFGQRNVTQTKGHVYQTSEAPIIIYHLPVQSLRCKAKPCITRRSVCECDQFLYLLRPNSTYVGPPGTVYLILTVQKTLFAVDILPWYRVNHHQNFKVHKDFTLQVYNLPCPTPVHECEPPTKKFKTTFVEPSPVHQIFVEPPQTFVESSPVPQTFVEPHQSFVEPSSVPRTFVEPSPVPETPPPVPEIDFILEQDDISDINNFLEIFGRDLFHHSPEAVLPPSHDSPAAVLPPQYTFWSFPSNHPTILPPPTISLPPDNGEESHLLDLVIQKKVYCAPIKT